MRKALLIMSKFAMRHIKYIAIMLMVMYLMAYFYITLLSRKPGDTYQCMPIPFWSYMRVLSYDGGLIGSFLSQCGFDVRPLTLDNTMLIREIILNVILYLPFGALNYFLVFVPNTRQLFIAVCNAAILSIATEMLQLFSRRGLFEFDDIFNNLLGCILGFLLIRSLKVFVTNRFCQAEKI